MSTHLNLPIITNILTVSYHSKTKKWRALFQPQPSSPPRDFQNIPRQEPSPHGPVHFLNFTEPRRIRNVLFVKREKRYRVTQIVHNLECPFSKSYRGVWPWSRVLRMKNQKAWVPIPVLTLTGWYSSKRVNSLVFKFLTMGTEIRICTGYSYGWVAEWAGPCEAWHPNRNQVHTVAKTAAVAALGIQKVAHMEHLSQLPGSLASNTHMRFLIPNIFIFKTVGSLACRALFACHFHKSLCSIIKDFRPSPPSKAGNSLILHRQSTCVYWVENVPTKFKLRLKGASFLSY